LSRFYPDSELSRR